METDTKPLTNDEPSYESAADIISALRQSVAAGDNWFDAVLEAIAQWVLPEEEVGDRKYRYLIAGEAFDWLLLAERLCQEIDGYIPSRELENLLFFGLPPNEFNEEDLRRAIGSAKYRAHLNYFYGVLVEEALQLSIEEDMLKERRSYVWANGADTADDAIFTRLYGQTHSDMLTAFYKQRSASVPDEISISDLKEFNYWLFKFRLNRCDPARVASDTHRGLAMLERIASRRRFPVIETECGNFDVDVEVSAYR
jgi:hypothetical protein